MRHTTRAVLLIAVALVPASRTTNAQSLNPPYLSSMPSVDKVKKAMQVSDPKETALRQIGAFWQLQEIIKALSGHREFRGYLPDEKKLLDAYWTAEYSIAAAADSAFPAAYKGFKHLSEYTPYRLMRTDPRFGVLDLDLFHAVLTPAIQAQYDQVVGVERTKIAVRAHEDSIARAEGERRMTAPPGAQPGQPASQLEKEQAGIRRCVESGRSETQCLTEGIGKSFMNMIGGFLPPGLTPPAIVGVRVVGTYPGPGKFALSFSNESASLTCGDLVPQLLEYTTTMTAGGVRIAFDGGPLPFPFTMRADGRLAGPAEADISGQVITGYQQGIRTYSDGRTEPISRPIYEPRTRHCAIGTLAVSSPTTQLASASALPAATLDFVLGGGDKKIWAASPTGLRLSGEYGSQAALDLEFRPEGVVVGCRQAVILRQYLVRLEGSKVMIDVQHGATPFTLMLGSDGKLTGSGTVKVDGRAITGSSPNGDFTYAPRSASCELGVLAVAG
ncbi:MAG TPA: hypothetical protein VGP61_03120 [Gemmatimonadales bacterium]|nr:hypothetical protein [Gemmatimonadales bacterium]